MAESNIEKNRFLATEVMGAWWNEHNDCEHDFLWLSKVCVNCGQKEFETLRKNPDYLSDLSDRQDLLEACVRKEWWGNFLEMEYRTNGKRDTAFDTYEQLLIPRQALATAIYRYLREKSDA